MDIQAKSAVARLSKGLRLNAGNGSQGIFYLLRLHINMIDAYESPWQECITGVNRGYVPKLRTALYFGLAVFQPRILCIIPPANGPIK